MAEEEFAQETKMEDTASQSNKGVSSSSSKEPQNTQISWKNPGSWVTVMTWMTIEPVMLLNSIAVALVKVTEDQMILYKTCMRDKFNLTQEFCENINDYTNSTVYTEEIEPAVAHYNVIKSAVDHTLPIFLSFYLGAWTDIFGRKILMYLVFGSRLIGISFAVLNAHFINWSPMVFLATAVMPEVLAGGYLALILSMYSFMSDNTPPERRMIMLGILSFSHHIATPIATPLGAFLFEEGGYGCVYGVKLFFMSVASIWLVARLWNFEENVVKKRKERIARGEEKAEVDFLELIHPKHIKESVVSAFRWRPDGKRVYLLLGVINMLLQVFPNNGESTFQYLYVVRFFNWGVPEYSQYNTIYSLITSFGMLTFLPTFHFFKFKDQTTLFWATVSQLAGSLARGFSTEPWMFYAAAGIDMLAHCFAPPIRAQISRCVHPSELGKVYAILSSAESIVPIIASNLYSAVYLGTVESKVPGTAYFLSATMSGFALTLTSYTMFALRGGRVIEQETRMPEEFLAEDKEKLRRMNSFHPDDRTLQNVQLYSMIPIQRIAN